MANTLTGLIPTMYESMDIVSRELVGFIPAVSRNSNAERAAKDQTVRYPIVPAVTGAAITAGAAPADSGDQTIGYGDMTISKAYAYPVRITGEEEMGLKTGGKYAEIARDRFAQALRAAVNDVEADIAALYVGASRAYGTAGTTPFGSSFDDAAEMLKILDDNGCPATERSLVLNTSAALNMRKLSGYTSAAEAGSDEQRRRGIILPLHGFDIRQSAQVKYHTKGTATGFDADGGEPAGETTIVVDGSDSGTILAGDVVTWAGDTNKYIVASTTASGAASGNIVIAKPGLLAPLATTVEGTIGSSYRANMAFHKSAIQLVTRLPAVPEGGDSADDAFTLTDPVSGLSFEVRGYRQYRRVKYEVCLAWGCAMVKPEFAGILLG